MKKKILILSVAFIFFANIAQAHFLGYSSVDAGEIRWGGSTTYSTQWNAGISTWNNLSPIDILPDTWWTYEDLTVSDVNRADGFAGLYTPFTGADTIELNKYYLWNDTSAQKQNVTTHELGHSLGLGHSYSGEIMYYQQNSQMNLGSHDVSDYHNLWGY